MSEAHDKLLKDQAHSRSCPIYWTKEQAQLPLITQIELVRNDLTKARGKLSQLWSFWGWKDRLDYAEGAITAVIIALANSRKDIDEQLVKWQDEEHGQSYAFNSRGLGTDGVPGCFVCGGGGSLLSNIAAYVDSEASATVITDWFKGRARIDWRGDWGYVKVGACSDHVGCLEELSRITSVHNRLWEYQIALAMNYEPPPPKVIDMEKFLSKLKYTRDELESHERKFLAELVEAQKIPPEPPKPPPARETREGILTTVGKVATS